MTFAQFTAALTTNLGEPRYDYKTFMSCKPKEFFGTEGTIGLLSWLESMESVLRISNCPDGRQVEFASCVLHGRALTWWNNLVQTRGQAGAVAITWDHCKKLLMEEFCLKDAVQRLESEFWHHTMIERKWRSTQLDFMRCLDWYPTW